MDRTICHFEIPVDDLKKAGAFYQELFGWEMKPFGSEDAIIWSITTVPTDETGAPIRPGVNGMLIKKQNPMHPFANYVQVEDIDTFAEKLVSLGGKIALPKTAVPGMGWFLYFMDLDNNILGLWQNDPAAGAAA